MSRLPSPCVRSLAQTISSLCTVLPNPRLSDYPPVAAEPSPVCLPSCHRKLASLTTFLLSPNPRLSDYPPDFEPSPVRLPCCRRTPACLTYLLSDQPSCRRTLACLSKDPLIDSASASLCVENLGSLAVLPHNIDSLSLTLSLEIFKHICVRV